jgi:ribosomal protein RSM22 (predicted rRNA methylase)
MDTDFPPDLQAGLDSVMQGVSRNTLAQRAAAISQAYRAGGCSAQAIRSWDDALAYALARLPATFAAVTAVLAALRQAVPHFVPRTLLDVGAGPGTASWAAAGCFPGLTEIRLVDENEHLRRLALDLLSFSAAPVLRDAAYRQGAARQLLGAVSPADLTIASYLIGELSDDQLLNIADSLWAKTADTLVIVEPGTPAGFARIRDVRSHLIAHHGHVVCPCPHDLECPLAGADWCHFSQRLNRSRDHRQVKAAALSFEDEKFSYVVLSKHRRATTAGDRVLASPRVTKAQIATKLCTSEGLVMDIASRRDRDAYKMRRDWRWGDAVNRSVQMNEASE